MYRDKPAGWLEEGTSGTLGLTLHIPRAEADRRAEPGASHRAAGSAYCRPPHPPASKEQSLWQEQVLTGTPVSHRLICGMGMSISPQYECNSLQTSYGSLWPEGQV